MSAVELLREAAKTMRERAQKATPGPWRIGDAVDPTTPCNIHSGVDASGVANNVAWLDAEHIASWHPAVALAVAGLLLGEVDPETVARVYLGRAEQ